jgi:serine/threonine-protein kinase HipA
MRIFLGAFQIVFGFRVDKGAWEWLAYKMALLYDVLGPGSRIEKVAGKFHTFFTRRFDQQKNERIHFAFAMTMTGQIEDTIKENPAGYLDMAECIRYNGAQNKQDLQQLWRRNVFNIVVSNTDDHLSYGLFEYV